MGVEKPLVSIIIPVFNGSDYLSEAIESALAQSWPNTEILVINDGSTDNTEEIALSYNGKIRYFKKPNGGQSSALNMGIAQMKGAYFSWLSHDDLYLPDKIEKQMALALQQPGAVIYSDWMSINAAGEEISRTRIYNSDPERFRFNLMTENRFHGCAMLVPKGLFAKHGAFKTDIPLTSDVELWFRLAGAAPFIHLPEILVKGRTHAGQVSVKKYRAHQVESDHFYANCFRAFSNEELMQAAESTHLLHTLQHLGRSFASREYWQAAIAVNQRIQNDKGKLPAMFEKAVCGFHYQKKKLKNRVKYGLLKGRSKK